MRPWLFTPVGMSISMANDLKPGELAHWGGWRVLDTDTGMSMPISIKASDNLTDVEDLITSDYRLHKRMLSSAASAARAYEPRCYLRLAYADRMIAPSSSSSMHYIADAFYQRAQHQLSALHNETDEDGDPVVEEGALQTASHLLRQLQRFDYAPPELSWHGGDAVVMLWAAGETTFALTVTDGEWGYVVQRGREQLRLADSISVDRLALEDLR